MGISSARGRRLVSIVFVKVDCINLLADVAMTVNNGQ